MTTVKLKDFGTVGDGVNDETLEMDTFLTDGVVFFETHINFIGDDAIIDEKTLRPRDVYLND